MNLNQKQIKILKLLASETCYGLCRGTLARAIDVETGDLFEQLGPLEQEGLVDVVKFGTACRRMLTSKGVSELEELGGS